MGIVMSEVEILRKRVAELEEVVFQMEIRMGTIEDWDSAYED